MSHRRLRLERLEDRRLLSLAPWGADFAPDSYTGGSHRTFPQCPAPAAAISPTGAFVLVWTAADRDGSGDGVYARCFDSQGAPAGASFRVNTTTISDQHFPAVAMDAAGNFVITWSSLLQDGSGYGVYARLYQADGTPRGDEFRVNTHTFDNQNFSAAAMDAAGNFVVVWTSQGQDGDRAGIFGRRFDAAGNPRGGEFQVNLTTASNQRYPSVAMDTTGAFTVTWTSQDQDGSGGGIYARRYGPDGAPLGGEILVNTTTLGNQQLSAVAIGAGGYAVVAWQHFDVATALWDVYCQRFDPQGNRLGGETLVGAGRFPSVSVGPTADFVVAWQTYDPTFTSPSELVIQHFGQTGVADGDPVRIYSTTGVAQESVTVAVTDSRAVLFWTSQYGDARNVRAQLLDVTLPEGTNYPPQIEPIGDRAVDEHQTLSFIVAAQDPDDPPQPVSFALVSGPPSASIDAQSGLFTWTPGEADGPGTYTVTVRASDAGSPSLCAVASFRVVVAEVNQPPQLAPIADRQVAELETLMLAAAAVDFDLPAQTLSYSLESGAPDGATIHPSTGLLIWTPSEAQGPGTYSITVVVRDDGAAALESRTTLLINVTETNQPPVFEPLADVAVEPGVEVSLDLRAVDPDIPASAVEYELVESPPGATIDPVSGHFIWPDATNGVHPITIRATEIDAERLSATTTFTIRVDTPMLDPVDPRQAAEGESLIVPLSWNLYGQPSATLRFSLSPGAPAGAAVGAETGVFTWTPDESQGPGDYTIGVTAVDLAQPECFDTLWFEVHVLETNQPPTLDLPSDVALLAGAPLHVALPGADADWPLDELSFTATSSNPLVAVRVLSGNRSLRIRVRDFGDMIFELFEDRAPRTTARIIELAQSGFYDGLTFHRVIESFMIQGGDPAGTGAGGSGVKFDDEFHPELLHTGVGVLSMANAGDDTNDCQFFITAGPQRHLDFNHSVFGQLVEGEAVRAAIAAVPTNSQDRPLVPVVIESVTVFEDRRNAVLLLSAPEGVSGVADVTVAVDDGRGGTVQQTIRVTVQPDPFNAPPYVGEITEVRTTAGAPVTFQIPALDAEGDPIDHSAVLEPAQPGITLAVSPTDGTVTVTPDAGVTGVFPLRLGVRAAAGGTWDTQAVPLMVAPAAPTAAWLAPGDDTGSSSADGVTSRNGEAGAELRVNVAGCTPGAEMVVVADGVPIGQATAQSTTAAVVCSVWPPLADGTHELAVRAVLRQLSVDVGNRHETIDLQSAWSPPLAIVVDTIPPSFTSEPPTTAWLGQTYVYDAAADDATLVVFALVEAPEGATLDTQTGRFTFTPEVWQIGPNDVVIRATDLAGNTSDQTFTLVVDSGVALEGGVLSVMGTGADDDVEITLGASCQVRLNGFEFEFPSQNVQTIAVDALDGADEVAFRCDTLEHTATARLGAETQLALRQPPAEFNVPRSDLPTPAETVVSVRIASAETIEIHAGAASDYVQVFDSPGDDQLELSPGAGTVSGAAATLRLFGFETIVAWSTSGGHDAAVMHDSPGNDFLYAVPGDVRLLGAGYAQQLRGFEEIAVQATSGGRNLAELHDSAMNDLLEAEALWCRLTSVEADYSHSLTGFRRVRAVSHAGLDTRRVAAGVDYLMTVGSWIDA